MYFIDLDQRKPGLIGLACQQPAEHCDLFPMERGMRRFTVTCLRLEHQLTIVCHRAGAAGTRGIPTPMLYVARVRRLFPDWSVEVSRLALRSPAFRTLCEDYGIAAEALDHLQIHNRPQDRDKVHEYRSLIQDLEKELKYELLAARPHDDPP